MPARGGLVSGAAWGGSAVPALAGLDGRFVQRVETSPFVGVVFVLLVIMIVITPGMTRTCWLCPGAATAADLPNGPVRLAFARDGTVWLRVRDETRRADGARMVPILREGLAESGDAETVYVMAEDELPFRDMLSVLDAAREAGARRVGFLASAPRASGRVRLKSGEPGQGGN